MRSHDALQPFRNLRDCRVPGDGFKPSLNLWADAAQRLQQAPIRITPFAVVGRRTFSAQRAAADGMRWIAANRRHDAVAFDD